MLEGKYLWLCRWVPRNRTVYGLLFAAEYAEFWSPVRGAWCRILAAPGVEFRCPIKGILGDYGSNNLWLSHES